ncbi:hypothetical protein [Sphingomonas bacterium]|uniref:hypothetical protein n=1 Tax=Sphingomonas bacterium TaxID=1895847 RepID=UPI001C2D01B3|nr:hypothetical protein [Sphingomonas bacterium]
MSLGRIVRGITIFRAGSLAWEAIRLGSMNQADRRELVDRMLDARTRRETVDPPAHVDTAPTPWNILREKAIVEYGRCGGHASLAWSSEEIAPMLDAQIIAGDRRRELEQERRSDMAYRNSAFVLRWVAVCREYGGCGPELPFSIKGALPAILAREAREDRLTQVPRTLSSAEPFMLSLACGMGLRARQGLPVLPDLASRAAAERACERGEQTACP